LAETCKKRNALGGSIVVLDPKSGDILALAMYPLYDLNRAGRSKPDHRRNRAITDLFEPGSVFKVFTLAGVLEERILSLGDKFHCENGEWRVAGKVLHDVHGYGALTLREIIEKSSNIGTVKAAMKLGAGKIHKYVRDFGFGTKTGVGLAGEIAGLVPHPKSWSRSSIINIPIGQGVAVTPIQLASAFAAIANDGVLMKPRLLTHVADSEGRIVEAYDAQAVRQVISKETALQVRGVLEGVVSRGTGKKAAVPGFRAAGKTGTAQKILPGGGYSHDHYGGEVAAPAFSKVASEILAYWQISQTVLPEQAVRAGTKLKKVASKPVEPAVLAVKAQ
jgi:cell division protein FtsI (penicillin-binding protein 3)